MQDTEPSFSTKLIVITGGPGAGKTAVLEMAKNLLTCDAIIMPEAASIIFGGGFWRLPSLSAKAAAQSAIFHVQIEMENLVCGEKKWVMGLCDRGTLDGLAYWPQNEESFWKMSNTNMEKELNKYYAVIHLRSPSDILGYNHVNPLRIESAAQSKIIDDKIANIWNKHPRYKVINSAKNFVTKAHAALELISEFQSECCEYKDD